MVSRKSRLPFEEFHARGYKKMATSYFSVKARRNSLGTNRLGVVMGTSSVKSAARRNFWRRQAKTAFLAVPQKGFDFLIIFGPHAALSAKNVFRKTLSETITSLVSHL